MYLENNIGATQTTVREQALFTYRPVKVKRTNCGLGLNCYTDTIGSIMGPERTSVEEINVNVTVLT